MMINTTKLNIVLSTLNFVLPFVGYQLASTLLLPMSSDIEGITRVVTVPYRAFALMISLIVLCLNLNKPIKITRGSLLLLIYWIMLLIRMFYDLEIRSDFNALPAEKLRVWLFALFITFVPMLSVLKSMQNIDLFKSFKWTYVLITVSLLIMVFANSSIFVIHDKDIGRLDGGMALDTISFGHLAATCTLLSFFLFKYSTRTRIKKIAILSMLLGLFIMLRAGSRGPFVALTSCLVFYFVSVNRRIWGVVFSFMFISIILYLCQDIIFDTVNFFSPTMHDRLISTIESGDTSGREPFFEYAINTFYDSPIIGGKFAIPDPRNGTIGYSHNIILDAFMGLGVIGGFLLIFVLILGLIRSKNLIKNKSYYWWIALIVVQNTIGAMTSGAIYTNSLLSITLIFIFQKRVNLNLTEYKQRIK